MTTNLKFLPTAFQPAVADAWANGRVLIAGPEHRRPMRTSWPAQQAPEAARRPERTGDVTGQLLIAGACLLLVVLAVAMGITSFHAQFTYIFATKRQWAPAPLEALGLDAGAVIFSLLGIALARLGRRAAVERVLVVVCASGSCGMNILNANLGSPRSVAVYAMPPILFGLTSDRLVAVVRRAAFGKAADDETQWSAWYLAGKSLLYGLRLAVDLRGTTAGLRQAILDATPLPQAAAALQVRAAKTGRGPAPDTAAPEQNDRDPGTSRSRPYQRSTSKTARFLALVQDTYGPLSDLDPANVYRVSTELAPKVRLNAGSARAALRAAVLAAHAQGGAR